MATNRNVEAALAVPALILKNSVVLPKSIWPPAKFSGFTKAGLRVMARHWQRQAIWFSGETSIKNLEPSMRIAERSFGKRLLEDQFKTAPSPIESMDDNTWPC